jgi:hypothetical protein
MEEIITA